MKITVILIFLRKNYIHQFSLSLLVDCSLHHMTSQEPQQWEHCEVTAEFYKHVHLCTN